MLAEDRHLQSRPLPSPLPISVGSAVKTYGNVRLSNWSNQPEMIKEDGYSFLQMTKSHPVQSSEFELLFHNYFCLSKFIYFLLKS